MAPAVHRQRRRVRGAAAALAALAIAAGCGSGGSGPTTAAEETPIGTATTQTPVDARATDYAVGDERGSIAVATPEPSTLVMVLHGCCYATLPGMRALMARNAEVIAAQTPSIAIAPDYRGDGNWNVRAGVEDVVNAVRRAKQQYPSIRRTILWGHSMGGLVALTAAARLSGEVDYVVAASAVTDLATIWRDLAVRKPDDAAKMTADMGGATPDSDAPLYATFSPVRLVSSLKPLTRLYVVHGEQDPLVPFDHAKALVAAARAGGIDITFLHSPEFTHPGTFAPSLVLLVKPLALGGSPLAGADAYDCLSPAQTAADPACLPME